MPGIFGLHTLMPRGWAETKLNRMLAAAQHDQSYVTGTWIDEPMGLYVGWVARKKSFSDGMPIRNKRGDITLTFSGEDFSDPETVQSLIKRGHQFEQGNPSYLVHCYESDPTFPASLNGRFHGLLVDKTRRMAMLFNDRYGLHRVYYHLGKDAFYFAAEAKAILAVCPDLRRIDPRAMGEFVTCGCVLENRTLFEGIYLLPNAAKWIIRAGCVEEKGGYFKPSEWEDQEPLEPEKYYQNLRDVFVNNLPRYFRSHEQVGMSLTGGLDTRMMLAWYKPQPRTLPCYTFSGPYRDCRDVTVARQVAEVCQQDHEVLQVGKNFLSRFSHYAERTVYLTDGCADVRRASDLYLNECARHITPVRMTGNYGSEVLRAVRAFKPDRPLAGLFNASMYPYFDQAEMTYAAVGGGHPLSFAVFRQAPWHHYGLLALEQTQLSVRTPFLDNEFVRMAFRGPRSAFERPDLCLKLIAEGNPSLRQIPTDIGLGNDGLMGSATQALLEFTKKAEYAYDYGMPQWVAKIDHMLSPLHLEQLFLGRHKFNHYRVWYRDILAGYVREMLLDKRTLSRPYLDRKKVEWIVSGHVKGNHNYTTEIHTILSLELLHRLFIDRS